MDELISRQAAIEALRTCYDTEAITHDNGDEYISYDQALDLMEQLPSVQPEQRTGKWIPHKTTGYLVCDQCRDVYINEEWLEDGKWSYCPGCGSYNGNNTAHPNWISLEDRYPDSNADVLVQFKSNMGVGFFEDGDWAINTGGGIYSLIGYNEEKPIAWTLLPTPYKPQD